MAPPLSPKERRRSNRRSAHSSASTSKSSGSPSPDVSLPPPPKETDAHSARSAASSSSNNAASRKQRNKDDTEDLPTVYSSGHRRTVSVSSITNHSNNASSSKRSRRKGGKEPMVPVDDVENPTLVIHIEPEPAAGDDKAEEDAGETRCVCEGLVDDEGDGADFMVQCEMCLVWQHGPCVGFADEGEIPEGEYYCEQCKPEDHVDLLRKLQRRQRQNSEKSHVHQSRNSRSHSPTHFQKTTKRRNTMNSRDAAYDEQIQKLLDATAAEAAQAMSEVQSKENAILIEKHVETTEEVNETSQGSKKKRKRIDDESANGKRKRSASVISERVPATAASADKLLDTNIHTVPAPLSSQVPPLATSSSIRSRVRRSGGRKHGARDASVAGEGEEGAPTRKHPNQYTYRVKAGANSQPRRAPQSGTSQNQANTHEHGTRRSAGGLGNTSATNSGSRSAHNAYYSNLQLPMFTSWNLPDYLAHLQSILPSEVPPPLHIRGAADFLRELSGAGSYVTNGAEASSVAGVDDFSNEKITTALASATEPLVERGVKVKWPAKRMSVADMNKRVRALVEWVGREQALALDRERRRAAILSALKNQLPTCNAILADRDASVIATSSIVKLNTEIDGVPSDGSNEESATKHSLDVRINVDRPSTTKMMEELMEELINFQERFGPGAKGQARERASRITIV